MSWGGQVKIVPTVEGFSTTGLIAKGAGAPGLTEHPVPQEKH